MARVHKNTVSHTGLLLWEAAFPLARFILACPSLFSGEPHANLYPRPCTRHMLSWRMAVPHITSVHSPIIGCSRRKRIKALAKEVPYLVVHVGLEAGLTLD